MAKKLSTSEYYDYAERIEEAYRNGDKAELLRIKAELEEYCDDQPVKELVLKLRR